MMGGVGGNGIYNSVSGSQYGSGKCTLPRISSDNDISAGTPNHNDVDKCKMVVELIDEELLNDKFEEMLVIKINDFYVK